MFIVEFMKKFLGEGGMTAYVILFAGMCLIVLAYERLNYLYFGLRKVDESSTQELDQNILKRQYTNALQICNSAPQSPEMQITKVGLMAVDSGREAMKSALSGAVVETTKLCERRISLIALIASVATLLGLLGTISGLIKTFAAIAAADPAKKAEMLGLGISEAMTSTAAGLVVGIAAMVVHTLCTTKIDEIVAQTKKAGLRLITLIEQSERAE